MRNQTRLLLSFVFVVLSTLADANSQNVPAVSYVNVSLRPGFSLVGNPLLEEQADNSVGALFKRRIQGTIPDGLTIYILEEDGYRSTTYDALSGEFQPSDVASEPLLPGRGFFVFNPTNQEIIITFVGTLLQGVLAIPLRQGFSLASSIVPKEGTPGELSFPGEPGDVVYFFNPTSQSFTFSIYDDLDNAWVPTPRKLTVAEGFVVLKQRPVVWTQVFSVN